MWPAWLLFWHILCAVPGIKSDSRSSHAVLYCHTYSFFPPRSREIFLWPSYSLSARSIMSGHNGSKATSFNAGTEPTKASWVHTLCGSVKKKTNRKKKTPEPLQRASGNNAIRPRTYIIGICTMKRTKQVQMRKEVRESNRWRSSCVATNHVSGWRWIESILPRRLWLCRLRYMSCTPTFQAADSFNVPLMIARILRD